jgi:hypothetical protein
MFLKKLALTLALTAAVWAEPPKTSLPDPLSYVDTSCVSFGVMHARADDQAIHRAMQRLWHELEKRHLNSDSWVGMLANFLNQGQRQQLLLGFLPFQGIRLDYLDNQGGVHSATVVTVAGWKGLQGLFWNRLLLDPQGRPWPTQRVGGADVVSARDGQLARREGTFYKFTDSLMAQRCLLKSHNSVPPLYHSLDRSHDTYGVLHNRQRSLRRFLTWMNMNDVAAVEKAMGVDDFRRAMEAVDYLTWQGEVLDDDRLDLEMRIHVVRPQDNPLVSELLTVARRVLKDRGRPAEIKTRVVGSDLMLDMVIGGNRQFFLDYLTKDKPV